MKKWRKLLRKTVKKLLKRGTKEWGHRTGAKAARDRLLYFKERK